MTKTTLIATLALQLTAAAALAQTESAPESESSLSVSRVVLSRGFADGEPVDETTTFARSDARIYNTAASRASAPSARPAAIASSSKTARATRSRRRR